MYVFSQLFFKTPHKTLKFKEKSKPAICRLKFQKKKIILCLPWGYLNRVTKQTVKKLNLWVKAAADKVLA